MEAPIKRDVCLSRRLFFVDLLRFVRILVRMAEKTISTGGASPAAPPLFPIVIVQQDRDGDTNDPDGKQGYSKIFPRSRTLLKAVSQSKKGPQIFLSKAMLRTRASLAVGLNCPVSIELMVWRDTPTSLASSPWDRFFSARAIFSRFFKISWSSHFITAPV